jgi:hypothetical protein
MNQMNCWLLIKIYHDINFYFMLKSQMDYLTVGTKIHIIMSYWQLIVNSISDLEKET